MLEKLEETFLCLSVPVVAVICSIHCYCPPVIHSVVFLIQLLLSVFLLLFSCCCFPVAVFLLLFSCCCFPVAVFLLLFSCLMGVLANVMNEMIKRVNECVDGLNEVTVCKRSMEKCQMSAEENIECVSRQSG